ncbi:hypothetical protein QAD02_003287 [Eretmocerus hayati]|uniref:Uncharacterized protein n=1 Tax=Eretmocerus hayati TaxID=131215 RepID=A0ACC2NMC4_9HYME|nr:hypothetical protein QAD02_003287 [Eretmocerus hayati]
MANSTKTADHGTESDIAESWSQSDSEYVPTDCESEAECNNLELEITISQEIWNSIAPVEVRYGTRRRRYFLLQDPWTHIINSEIWNVARLPCGFIFKHCYRTKSTYLRFDGSCREPKCAAPIEGICKKDPGPGNSISITITTSSSSHSIPHDCKLQIKGKARDTMKKKLLHERAAAVIDNEGERLMVLEDVEPAIIPSSSTARKIREEAKKELDPDLGAGLLKFFLNQISKSNTIKDFGVSPFHLIWMSDDQIKLWNLYMENVEDPQIDIDASGKFVTPIKIFGYASSHTFLYAGTINFKGSIVCVVQMLSSKHDTLFLKRWLETALLLGAKISKTAVSDNSGALQNAMSLAYNNKSYKENLDHGYKNIKGLDTNILPCYIRMDVNHLIHAVGGWKCFKRSHPIVKDLYVKSVGYLTSTQQIEHFEKFLSSMIILSSSPCINGLVLANKNYIVRELTTYQSLLNSRSTSGSTTNSCAPDCGDVHMNNSPDRGEVLQRADELLPISANLETQQLSSPVTNKTLGDPHVHLGCCRQNDQATQLSHLLSTTYSKMLSWELNLAKQAPAWTGLMLPFYKTKQVGTSASIERHFCDLRNTHGFDVRTGPDVFYLQYTSRTSGKVKRVFASIRKELRKQCENPPSSEANLVSGEPVFRKRNRGIHVTPQPDLARIHELSAQKRRRTIRRKSVIVNACISESVVIDGKSYVLRDSSLFDSLFEVFFHGYTYHSTFQDFVNRVCGLTCNYFMQTLVDFYQKASLKQFESRRARIIKAVGITDGDVIHYPDHERDSITAMLIKILSNVCNTVQEFTCYQCSNRYESGSLSLVMAASPDYLTTICDDPVICVCPLCGHGLGSVKKLVGFIGACFSPNSSLMQSLRIELRRGKQTFILVGGVGKLKKSEPHNSFLRYNKGSWIDTARLIQLSEGIIDFFKRELDPTLYVEPYYSSVDDKGKRIKSNALGPSVNVVAFVKTLFDLAELAQPLPHKEEPAKKNVDARDIECSERLASHWPTISKQLIAIATDRIPKSKNRTVRRKKAVTSNGVPTNGQVDAPVDDAPVDDVPVDNASVDNASANNASVENADVDLAIYESQNDLIINNRVIENDNHRDGLGFLLLSCLIKLCYKSKLSESGDTWRPSEREYSQNPLLFV